MLQVTKLSLFLLVVLLAGEAIACGSVLLAQSANNQQEFDETVRSAQRFELIGYILGGAGIVLVILVIPLGIYLDRKKKVRRRVSQQAPNVARSSPPEPPET